jgi:hypothetical protein
MFDYFHGKLLESSPLKKFSSRRQITPLSDLTGFVTPRYQR